MLKKSVKRPKLDNHQNYHTIIKSTYEWDTVNINTEKINQANRDQVKTDQAKTDETKTDEAKLWETIVQPLTFEHVLGQDLAKKAIQEWFLTFNEKPLLLAGPSGCGKTSLATTFLASKGFTVCVNGDINDAIEKLSVSSLLRQNNRDAIIIECAEGLSSDEKTHLLKSLKKNKKLPPIIITCDDVYSQSLLTIRKSCQTIILKKLSSDISIKLLLHAASKLQKPLSKESAELLLESANGNVRHAINTMQFMILTKHRQKTPGSKTALTETDERLDLFSTTSKLCCGLYSTKLEDIASSDIQLSLLMLHQNGPLFSKDIFSAAQCLDALSMSDILLNRQFTSHSISISVPAVSYACKGSKVFPKLSFPSYLLKMSQRQNKSKQLRSEAAGNIPIIGPAMINDAEKCKSTPLMKHTTLDQIYPTAYSSHDLICVRNAYKKSKKK